MPLAVGFRLGVAARRAAYRRGWLETRRLNRPVVSVGNLTAGGTGKTPLVAYIARRLLARGFRPAILTRGYGRSGGAKAIALDPGRERNASPRELGDEPALLARMLPEVPIVVCADRYRGGQLAEERFDVDVHLLDDGFQHWALARDVDIVTLDVTQRLSDRELLPAGRQREPCSALTRADLIVLTRTELGDSHSVENQIREIHPNVALFHCRTSLRSLVDLATHRDHAPGAFQGRPVVAVCGIGNPGAFLADLKRWGFSVVRQHSFRDHHVYTVEELTAVIMDSLKGGAKALVTTEKDAMNLPPGGGEFPILACVTDVALDEAEAFEAELLARIEAAKKKD